MRVLGIDPSSSCCGLAWVEGTTLLHTTNWKPTKGKSGVWNLANYAEWLATEIRQSPAHLACVEFLSVMQNAQSTRLISHYQAVSGLVCKQANLVVIEGRVSSARKEALGRGNMSKEEAWQAVKKMYPDHKFANKTTGGMDETDATTLALAGPGLAERISR